MVSIVLIQPLIPQNTGNIARLTACTKTALHLIEPLGFELSDRYLKRAGLDYWPETQITIHRDWESFLESSGCRREQLWFFSTRGERNLFATEFLAGDFLVFGNESQGLPPEFHDRYGDRRVCVPMDNPNVRSLNLSNAVSVGLYEAKRQLWQRETAE